MMQSSGETRRENVNLRLNAVGPAKAGTHNPKPSISRRSSAT
jgi:hypothetical protein